MAKEATQTAATIYGTYKIGQGIYDKVTQVNTAGTIQSYGNSNNVLNTSLNRVSPYSGQTFSLRTLTLSNISFLTNIKSLDEFVDNPEILKNITPKEMHEYLKLGDYNLEPLSRGEFKGIPFEEGGGFKSTWGGDRILQYHPEGGVHSGSYWKISSGPTGIKKIPISGKYIP